MCDSINQIDKVRDFVWTFQLHYGSYHNHKENMAHAAMAAQVALTIAVMTWDKWPPECWNVQGVLLRLGIWLLWIALYLYTGWEMVLRRWSATVGVAIEVCASKLSKIESLENYEKSEVNQVGRIYELISFLLWLPWTCDCFDVKPKERKYPQQLLDEIENVQKQGDKRLLTLEVIFFLASLGCATALLWKGLA